MKLARVCANESTRPLRTDGAVDADCRGIAATVHAWAAWQRTSHTVALHRLAPHVTQAKPPTRRRHAVYAQLPAHGTAKPPLWDDVLDGNWSLYARNWARFRDAVIVMARGFESPCPMPVIAWGNEQDDRIAISRGLVRQPCGALANRFWALPSERVLSAEIARGGR